MMITSAWKLLLLASMTLVLQRVAGDIYIMTDDSAEFALLPDIPADFGPELPDEGVSGLLRVADPEDGCMPFTYQDFSIDWVALISRNQLAHSANCTFDVKVINAQAAGAQAAIVYDDVVESLIIMSKPHGHADPFIPSAFISQKNGVSLKELLLQGVDVRVRLLPSNMAVAWMSSVTSAFLGLMALGVVLATFYVMRSWSLWLGGQQQQAGAAQQQQRAGGRPPGAQPGGAPGARPPPDSGLAPEVLRSLPVVIYSLPGTPLAAKGRGGSLTGAAGSCSSSYTGGGSKVGPGAACHDDDDNDLERGLLEGICEDDGGGDDGDECQRRAPSSRGSSECGGADCGGAQLPRWAHAGETKRTCAVCLESYREGEKVRVLPCKHRFHMGCIDQWLSSRRFCPVCKHDASQPLWLPPPPPPAQRPLHRSGGGAAGALGSHGVSNNGWALLFAGLVDIFSPARRGERQQPAAAAAGRPQQQQLQQRGQAAAGQAGRRSARGDVDILQEPLLAPQQQQLLADQTGAGADVEAPAAQPPQPQAQGPAGPIAIAGTAAGAGLGAGQAQGPPEAEGHREQAGEIVPHRAPGSSFAAAAAAGATAAPGGALPAVTPAAAGGRSPAPPQQSLAAAIMGSGARSVQFPSTA